MSSSGLIPQALRHMPFHNKKVCEISKMSGGIRRACLSSLLGERPTDPAYMLSTIRVWNIINEGLQMPRSLITVDLTASQIDHAHCRYWAKRHASAALTVWRGCIVQTSSGSSSSSRSSSIELCSRECAAGKAYACWLLGNRA